MGLVIFSENSLESKQVLKTRIEPRRNYMLKVLSIISLIFAFSAPTMAGECVMKVTRSACPGKDADSYAKCNGQKSCEEKKKTGSADACAKEATKSCQNKRFDVTQDKSVMATFDGAAVEGGKDFCKDATAGVYDPKTDYPFRGKSDCK